MGWVMQDLGLIHKQSPAARLYTCTPHIYSDWFPVLPQWANWGDDPDWKSSVEGFFRNGRRLSGLWICTCCLCASASARLCFTDCASALRIVPPPSRVNTHQSMKAGLGFHCRLRCNGPETPTMRHGVRSTAFISSVCTRSHRSGMSMWG